MNREAWQVVERIEDPFLTLDSDGDVVAPYGYRRFTETVAGAKGHPHAILKGGSHFLQEDVGDEYYEVLVKFLEATQGLR